MTKKAYIALLIFWFTYSAIKDNPALSDYQDELNELKDYTPEQLKEAGNDW